MTAELTRGWSHPECGLGITLTLTNGVREIFQEESGMSVEEGSFGFGKLKS